MSYMIWKIQDFFESIIDAFMTVAICIFVLIYLGLVVGLPIATVVWLIKVAL